VDDQNGQTLFPIAALNVTGMKNGFQSTALRLGRGIFLTGMLLIAGVAAAGEKQPAKETDGKKMRRGIIFETQTMDPEVFTRVEGAKKTLMVPVHEWDYGVRLFSAKEWKEQAFDNAEFRRNAEEVADAVMATVEPEFIRDSRDVVLYALIRGEDPFLSSILLSSKFLPLFKKSLGDSVRVVLIDRQLIYVFPGSGGKLDEFGAALAEQYQAAKQPVSLEIFEVSSKGFKVIGSTED
jgi:hypothetical protein